MNSELLQELGLNKAQAKVYLTLIQNGAMTPVEVSDKSGETRTNSYMVLDRLQELGLVEQVDKGKTKRYQATNPMALEQLTSDRKKKITEVEQRVKASMPMMLSYFYSFTEKPGVRLFEGKNGLKEIYQGILRSKKDHHYIRAAGRADSKALGSEFFSEYRKKRAELGITTYSLNEDLPSSREHANTDKERKIVRTWLKSGEYREPVQISVHGDKTDIISFGDEIMAVEIDSPAIAKAMINIFELIKKGRETGDYKG